MPKELTHILFADVLLDDLGGMGHNDLASFLERHRSILHFGSIATDTLYYEVTFPIIDRNYAHWGEIIHGGRGEDTGTPIREMLRRYKRMSMPDLLNISVNSTLSRSIITHVTVTLALLALLLFGGKAIHSFTATMMFGVVLVGTYTSIFIASPILIYLGVGTNRLDDEEQDKAAKPAKKPARP